MRMKNVNEDKLQDSDSVVLMGHYGSGKTEVAINLAIQKRQTRDDIAIIDLDIANPYFRSREMSAMFSERDIELVSNAYGFDISADLPALSPTIKHYLEDDSRKCVVDVGGNDIGARILNQYKSQLRNSKALFCLVVNVFRPETDSVSKIIDMMRSIERETGQTVQGIINNSNLLKSTEMNHMIDSMEIIESVSKKTGVPIVAHCCEEKFCKQMKSISENVMPLTLYMRPNWLDA